MAIRFGQKHRRFSELTVISDQQQPVACRRQNALYRAHTNTASDRVTPDSDKG
jgi:hypothetical protein